MLKTPPPTPPQIPDDRPKADRRALRGRLVVREGTGSSDRSTPRTMLAAIAVHIVVIAVLVRLVTLGHGLHDWFGLMPSSDSPQERITYVEPKKPEPKPAERTPEPKTVVKATQVQTPPAAAPSAPTVPAEVAIDPALLAAGRSGGDSSGAATGKPRVPGINPALVGVAPALSDARVWASSGGTGINVPRSNQQMLDSVIGWTIAAAADSIDSIARLYDANRKPAEWVKRMKNGEKWGWDKTGLRLGKFTVPNALLALLPAGAQRGMQSNPMEAASSRAILLAREDINRFQSQAMGEADFRKALKEMRARKDREYEARSKARAAEDNKPKQATPPKAAGGN